MARNRSCDSPSPSVGGKNCPGDNQEYMECNNHCCGKNLFLTLNVFSYSCGWCLAWMDQWVM